MFYFSVEIKGKKYLVILFSILVNNSYLNRPSHLCHAWSYLILLLLI